MSDSLYAIHDMLQKRKKQEYSIITCVCKRMCNLFKCMHVYYHSCMLQGDSGGPLMCQSHGSNVWKLVGVFSFITKGCSVPMRPPVFTRIQAYLSWLNSTMRKYRSISSCINVNIISNSGYNLYILFFETVRL